MFCKQCGFEIKDSSLKKCLKCNTAVGKGGRFCPDCGKRLNSGEKCDCLSNIPSKKCETVEEPVQNAVSKDSGRFVAKAVQKQTPYVLKEESSKKPAEVNKRIAGNPLLEKIARGEDSEKSKEIIRNEAVKIVYGKDMTADKLREQRAAELKAEEERKLAEQKLKEQRKAEEQKQIEEEKRIKKQKQAEEKMKREAEKKRLEAEKHVQQVNPAPPYPIDTLRQPQQVAQVNVPVNAPVNPQVSPQEIPQSNIQRQLANVKTAPQPVNSFNSNNNANINAAPNAGNALKTPDINTDNQNNSQNLFPEAFAPENMSYKPEPGNIQRGPTSTKNGPIKVKTGKNFDGMWVAGIICTLAAFASLSLIIKIVLLVISTVFGVVDVFLNKRKTGVGVVVGNIVAVAAIFLSTLI